MSTPTVREIVRRKRKEYLKAKKGEKKHILDEIQRLTGYHRKSLARLFVEGVPKRSIPVRRPRAAKYEPILPQLKVLWATSFYACGKRLAPFLPELVLVMKRCGEIQVTPKEEALLLSISSPTIDRMLPDGSGSMTVRGRTLTKPGTLLKSKIPVRTFADWKMRSLGSSNSTWWGIAADRGAGSFCTPWT